MNFEAMPNERPKKVEVKAEELLPTAEEMNEDPEKIKAYINLKIAQLDPATRELISKEVGETGIKREARLREAIEKTLPIHLEAVKSKYQNQEGFEKVVNKVIENTLKGFKM